MNWKVKVITDNGSLILPLNGSYRTKTDAEKDAERARSLPGTIKADVVKR
jgi:hypothetical protein